MHVVWKRPDGYHGAHPSDFTVVDLGSRAKIWLHKTDHSWFPFRVSGGWQESEATQRLNNLVNLLNQDDKAWVERLLTMFNNNMAADDAARFFDETSKWIGDLRSHLKGDTWELDIMNQAVTEVQNRLNKNKDEFLKRAVSS